VPLTVSKNNPKMSSNPAGILTVISGPSGVGKSTICRKLVDRLGAVWAFSATTRPRADQDRHGKPYRFVSRQKFQSLLTDGQFLEHAEVFGQYYGTLALPVRTALDEGKTVILEIDVQGAKQIAEKCPDALFIFLLPPDEQALTTRINDRGRDTPEAVKRRLAAARHEIQVARDGNLYQHQVVNDHLDACLDRLEALIRSKQKPSLTEGTVLDG